MEGRAKLCFGSEIRVSLGLFIMSFLASPGSVFAGGSYSVEVSDSELRHFVGSQTSGSTCKVSKACDFGDTDCTNVICKNPGKTGCTNLSNNEVIWLKYSLPEECSKGGVVACIPAELNSMECYVQKQCECVAFMIDDRCRVTGTILKTKCVNLTDTVEATCVRKLCPK